MVFHHTNRNPKTVSTYAHLGNILGKMLRVRMLPGVLRERTGVSEARKEWRWGR